MADRKALVLGGGGITGAAWEVGLMAGLAQAGVDLASADVVVGTSAGSVAGSQILSGTSIEALYARQLEDPTAEVPVKLSLLTLLRFALLLLLPGDERASRARVGRAALRAQTMSESKRVSIIASRLPSTTWPETKLLITAVDAETGEFRVFDRHSGVALIDAVAASCAAPMVYPAITINGRRYIDGGARSAANADLATDSSRVVVIAPLTIAFRRSQRIDRQLASLGQGVRSLVVSPDAEARRGMGRQALDPANRASAARAGRNQAKSVAGAVGAVWSSNQPDPTSPQGTAASL